MVEGVAFFQKLSPDMRLELCRVMVYERRPQNHILFQKGDSGDKFYVIFKGGVWIYVGGPIEDENTKKIPLGEGKGFGELALVNDDPRAATVVCESTCEFLTIQREPYNKILRESYLRDVVSLMNKEPEQRSMDDIRLLLDLTKGNNFFESRWADVSLVR